MELTIDASILFCALIGKGVTKDIIFSKSIKTDSPKNLFDELDEHRERVQELSGLSPDEFDSLLDRLKDKINVMPLHSYEKYLKQANLLIPDKDDTEYLALSLSLGKIPIWSNDPHFKQQSLIKVFNTSELVEHLKSEGFEFS